MKTTLLLLTLCLPLLSWAKPKTLEVDVISYELGALDQEQQKTLCLTVVRVPQNGKLLGIVEDLYDCFYARAAKRAPRVRVLFHQLTKLQDKGLLLHLQSREPNLEFYLSGE